MVGMGFWFAGRQKNTNDYFRAGRRVPWWAVSLSIYATMLSSITFMAVPAKAFATDWTFALANLAPLLLVPIIIRYYLPFFRRLDVTSAYEYLEHRFNLAVRLYASAAFVLFQCGRMAIVIFLPSLALAASMGLEVHLCILLIGALCVLYTTFGGMEAVIWTDVVQAIVLLGVAFLSLALVIMHLDGGLPALWAEASAHGKLRVFDWRWDATAAVVWVVLLGNVFSNLTPYTADQTVVQRYMAARDERQAGRALWTQAVLGVFSTVLFFSIGTALFAFYRQHPEQLEPALGTDAVFPLFIAQVLPAGIAGIAIAGIFAAAQSTVSSSLNSIVAALTTDFFRRFKPGVPDSACLRLARWLTVGVGVFGTGIALAMAEADIRSLWDAYLGLLGLLGSGLAGLFALGIFSTRANGAGALIGAVVSAAVLAYVQRHTSLHFFLYALVGVAVCVAAGWLASVAFPGASRNLAGLTWRTRERRPGH
jgi:SSS family transporter